MRRPRTRSPRDAARRGFAFESLERRELLATIAVSSLGDSGPGSLRQAIIESNRLPGEDTIEFQVAGPIRVGRAPLPAITDRTIVDGATAPGFSGSPLVSIDFRGTRGLQVARGADGSVIRPLSLVGAGNAGVTLLASGVTVEGNYVGLRPDGVTVAANRGDGVRVDAQSRGNLIGHLDPVTSIDYYTTAGVSMQPVSGWQGIRAADTAGEYLIVGTSNANGLLYVGPITGNQGSSYAVNYPGATTTSVYGPDNLDGDLIRLVGSYKTGDDMVNGFVFEGTTADLTNSDHYRTIDSPGAKFTYVHSTMGGLAVGNYDGPTSGGEPIGVGHAFIYDVRTDTFVTDITFPGALSNTAYGIWHNGGTRYTICGGYSLDPVEFQVDQGTPIGSGFLVDYDSVTGQFSNWKSFDYPVGVAGIELATHFEGISSVEDGVYTLNAGSVQSGTATFEQGSWVTVRRNPDGSFGESLWVDLDYPGSGAATTSDSVIGNQVVGIVLAGTGVFAYQATVNTGFQLSNASSAATWATASGSTARTTTRSR